VVSEDGDEIDKAFSLAKNNLKRKLERIETQQVRLGPATSQMRIAFALSREDAKRAEAVTMNLLGTQPPYSTSDQTEVALQFAVASQSRARLERIIAAHFVDIKEPIVDAKRQLDYSQDHGRTILDAFGIEALTKETEELELNASFAKDYQYCLRKIAERAIEACKTGLKKFDVELGRILPETEIVLGKLVKIEWYKDYQDYLCAKCTLKANYDGKTLWNSPEHLNAELGLRYFW
jgi:hypothetical protein